ncbi:hypothetical protein [Aridibaculum aurantiacum]|uniref:hypothetical protein n=1 Tax=Aridibaculum aurantiacum TaxID=2810307 RepID=UPI001A95A1A5|nr:hypothetical protein [Aridibaculum aurantiacum]
MTTFKSFEVPPLEFQYAVKKPIPIRCIQINEPFKVETMEGPYMGKAGDYLMVGVKGEMYPCDKEVFEETYEFVSDLSNRSENRI